MHTDPKMQVAERVAKRYARRVWWADFDDMVQTAATACVEAERKFDPAVGVPLKAYLDRAATFAVRRMLWAASAPVTAPKNKGSELAGLHRAELTNQHDKPTETWAEHMLQDKQWNARVRERLQRLLAHGQSETDADMALGMWLDGHQPRDVAASMNVPVRDVYRARRKARELVLNDLDLYRLWKELWE